MRTSDIAGRRILVTRAAEDAERWADRLRRLGAFPILLPCLDIITIANAEIERGLRAALAEASWLVLSARRAVEAVARLAGPVLPPAVRVAVVGPSTARAAAEWLGRVDLVATESSARGLARALLARLDGNDHAAAHVVVAGAANGRTDVEVALAAAGIRVVRVDLYATVAAAPAPRKLDLAAEGIDAVLLASPTAAEGLVNRALVPPHVHVITIGPTTSAAAAAVGLTVRAEARRPDLAGMLEALP